MHHHIHQRCFSVASVLLFPRILFLLRSDVGEKTQWYVQTLVVLIMYSGMNLFSLGFTGIYVVWIVYIDNSDLEEQILKIQREAILARTVVCVMPALRTVNLVHWEQEGREFAPCRLILSVSQKGHRRHLILLVRRASAEWLVCAMKIHETVLVLSPHPLQWSSFFSTVLWSPKQAQAPSALMMEWCDVAALPALPGTCLDSSVWLCEWPKCPSWESSKSASTVAIL